MRAIYDFARLLDESGGDRSMPPDEIDAQLDVIYSDSVPAHPLLRALAVTVRECALPPEPLRRLVEASRRDRAATRYATFDDLLDYSRLSAAPIGELVLHVFGAATPGRVRLSDAICAALQVTGHLQDVAQDHAHGLTYLPVEDMWLVGCLASDLEKPTASPALRTLMMLEVERARALLAEGAPLVRRLPLPGRLIVAGFVADGRATLDALEHADYDVLGAELRPGRRQLATRVATAWWGR